MEYKLKKDNNTIRKFWQGNEAIAEGAIAAGCRFFAGYPITPSSEILEHLSKRLPQIGGVCVQMEDEIASLGAVIGASWTGVKAMTATSGPGFSLMQENIGYAAMTETPCVIVDVMRVGPSTGQATLASQGDVYQARYGSHCADYEIITLVPSTVKESYELIIHAFNLAEKYRTPVIFLPDEHISHMRETIEIPEKQLIINRKKPTGKDDPIFGTISDNELVPPMPSLGEGYNVLVTGSTHDLKGFRDTLNGETHRKLVYRLGEKITCNKKEIIKIEENKPEDAEIGIVSYGSVSRTVWELQELAEEENIRLAHLRLVTLWPFPDKEVKLFTSELKNIIVPELNSGLIVREIERCTNGKTNVHSFSKIGGEEPITPKELLDLVVNLS
ncbi:MAG: 2-oxoacid:acceptor oxidoreductase subunit alpha [Thermoplasmatales archaeon]|nr:MAG: 2-oxoacid:acceptor oxidoreductase subunit alpha [Thermoplasmatales archaeon]